MVNILCLMCVKKNCSLKDIKVCLKKESFKSTKGSTEYCINYHFIMIIYGLIAIFCAQKEYKRSAVVRKFCEGGYRFFR